MSTTYKDAFAAAGFHLESTGGGCTAWIKYLDVTRPDSPYVICTGDELSHEQRADEKWELSLYEDGAPMIEDMDLCVVYGVAVAVAQADKLLEIAAAQDAKPWFVNWYLHDRAYGGPEEGGWYFDTYMPVSYGDDERIPEPSIPCHTGDEAREVAMAQKAIADALNEGRPNIGSVLSRGCYVALIERHKPEYQPKHRPHYE